MQRHYIAALLTVVASLACAQSVTEREKHNTTTSAQGEALAMRQAAEKAQATLDDFLAKASQLPAGTKSYAVKVGVREGRDTEYFWVDEFSWSDGTFTGRINDEPRVVKRIKAGQIHRFSRSDVVDWTYVDEKTGKTFGNFTASN
ncbi:MAG TPA: DUF2314 domain-containing protein [Burkholderiaceae bacterium]